ncbi:MAG: hypothetical protein R3281_01750 [Balneolaceae bacterium]|nr:hypothetical protein [Balneolaceae bacterium]
MSFELWVFPILRNKVIGVMDEYQAEDGAVSIHSTIHYLIGSLNPCSAGSKMEGLTIERMNRGFILVFKWQNNRDEHTPTLHFYLIRYQFSSTYAGERNQPL